MGAHFETIVMFATDASDLEKQFQEIMEQCRVEYGTNPYSGTWATLDGIKIVEPELVPDERSTWLVLAEEWLMDNCQKWEYALAIYSKNGSGYVVGGWLAE